MDSIVKKAERIFACSTCGWNQFCINPPSMTRAEIEEKIKAPTLKDVENMDGDAKEAKFFMSMLDSLFYAGRDTQCSVCPKFAEELRKNDTLIQKIKAIMKELS